ncbi:MAG: trypsin-like peptidase domain-containing protein [Deltaproteobacteria bacterium]|nr:trypsin-like peptidase domain-containing protein [Deltaproteobacteria bacterium]
MVPTSFVDLVQHVKGAVVNVFAAQVVRGGLPNPFGGPWGAVPDRIQRSLGTGFVIDSEGYVITNNHVIEHASDIRVQTSSNEEVSASVVGLDDRTDVALLRISARNLVAPPLGDSDALQVGEWVVAIGNPFGLSQTVTAGIVSAKGRTGRDVPIDPAGYYNFIQTDASINPGNSGGPLFNMRGEIVGINTAINAAGQGIGFAIPINMVKQILPQLRTSGRVTRSWLGISIQSVTRDAATQLGLPEPKGALVVEVFPGGPAASAGLRSGDVILEFDGQAIRDSSELPWLASTAGVGHIARLDVFRGGSQRQIQLRLVEMPPQRR